MSEILVNIQGYGNYSLDLSMHEPAPDGETTDVWQATICDIATGDCEHIYYEMDGDYEIWDLIDEAIQTYRKEIIE